MPSVVHVLTAIHGAGAFACGVMAVATLLSTEFRDAFVVAGGSTIMVECFRRLGLAFWTFVSGVLATLAFGSWHLRAWAWTLTLIVYGIGVLGSLWQVSIGIPQGWVFVIGREPGTFLTSPPVRRMLLPV